MKEAAARRGVSAANDRDRIGGESSPMQFPAKYCLIHARECYETIIFITRVYTRIANYSCITNDVSRNIISLRIGDSFSPSCRVDFANEENSPIPSLSLSSFECVIASVKKKRVQNTSVNRDISSLTRERNNLLALRSQPTLLLPVRVPRRCSRVYRCIHAARNHAQEYGKRHARGTREHGRRMSCARG